MATTHGRKKGSSWKTGTPDEGWAWVVLVASFFNILLLPLPYFCFSVLFVDWQEYYNAETSVLALLGSLQVALMFCCNMVAGVLVNLYGVRPVSIAGCILCSAGVALSSFANSIPYLFVTYGILTGCGDGLAFLPSSAVVQLYFDKKRALAGGIAICGLSVGALAGPPIMRLLIDYYGWRGALLILSGLVLQATITSCAFRPLEIESRESDPTDDKAPPVGWCRSILNLFELSLWCDLRFTLYTLGTLFAHCGLLTFIQHGVNYAVNKGIDKHTAALIQMMSGLSTLIVRIVISFVANIDGCNRVLQYGISCLITAVVIIGSFIPKSTVAVSIQYCLFGGFVGAMVTVQHTVLVDLLGKKRLSSALGMSSAIIGVGFLISSPLSGALLDATGSYDWPFAIVGLINAVGGFMLIAINFIHKRGSNCYEESIEKSVEADDFKALQNAEKSITDNGTEYAEKEQVL